MDSAKSKFRPKKSLGQNYLTDDNISRNIVNAFEIKPDDHIVEIGAGTGALTRFLLEKSSNLSAIEIDANNCGILAEKFPACKIINDDFLNVDLNSIAGKNKIRVIGNIPYNLTTDILFKLIDNRELISDSQLMIQEEVAKRFTASPNSKEYGITSVFVQVFSKPKLLFKVSKNCFQPPPKIDSRIIQFNFQLSLEEKIKDLEFFKRFVRTSFGKRRKQLRNSLKDMELEISAVDFDFNRRPENLSVMEFIELSNKFKSEA